MLRSLTAIGITLALVGSAHAQEQNVTVALQGKSHAAVRSEIYRAAETVCAADHTALDSVDYSCIEATYSDAMNKLRTSLTAQRIAYVIPPSAPAR